MSPRKATVASAPKKRGRPRKSIADDPDVARLVEEAQAEQQELESQEDDVRIEDGNAMIEHMEGGNGHSGEVFTAPLQDDAPEPEPMPKPDFVGPPPSHSPPASNVVVSRSTIKRPRQPAQPRGGARTAGAPEINAVLGSAVSFRFSKMDDRGGLAYINEFTLDDLRPYGNDIERFIREILLASYGDGYYFVEAKDERGQIAKQKRYQVLSPYQAPAPGRLPTGAVDNAIIDRLLAKIERAEEAERNRPQPDPIAQLRALQEVVGPKNDGSALMMLMMMQQQQHRGPDPELTMLREQLAELRRQASMPPPPPPPPPAPSVIEQLIQAAPLLQTLLAPMLSKPSFTEEITKLATALGPMLQGFVGDRSNTAVEVAKVHLEHLKEKIEDLQHGDTISQTIENLRQAKELFKEVGPTAGNAFTEIAKNWENNARATAEMLRALKGEDPQQVRLGAGKAAPQQLPAQPQAEQQITYAEPPVEFIEAVGKVNEATDDRQRLLLMVHALQILHGVPEFRSVPARLMVQLKMGFADKFTELVSEVCQELSRMGILGDPAMKAVIRSSRDNFDEIRSTFLAMQEAPQNGQEEADDGEEEDEAAG